MSEQNVKINVITAGDPSGAQKVDASIKSLNNSAQQAGTGPLKRLPDAADSAGRGMGKMGQLANQASFQVNDFAVQVGMGTSAVTAFAQQAPQLLGSFASAGVMTSGVALSLGVVSALIPILIYGLPALGRALGITGDGADKAKKSAADLGDQYKELLKVYQEFENMGKEARDKAAAEQDRALKKANTHAELQYTMQVDASSLDAAIDKARLTLQLAKDKLALSRVEAALVTATGEKAVELAKTREAIIKRIYADEQAIADVQRQAALDKAQAQVDKAQANVTDTSKTNSAIAGDYQRVEAEIQAIRDAAKAAKEEALRKIDEEIVKLAARKDAAQAESDQLPRGAEGTEVYSALISRLEESIRKLFERSADISKPNWDDVNLAAQIDAKEGTLKELGKRLDDSADAQDAAAKALTEASLALKNLRQTQNVESKNTADVKQVEDTGDLMKKVDVAGSKTAEQIAKVLEDVIKAMGDKAANSPAVQQALARVKALAADGVQAGEANEVVGLVGQLVQKIQGQTSQSMGYYQQIIAAVNASVTTQATLAGQISAMAARQAESDRAIGNIQKTISNPNY